MKTRLFRFCIIMSIFIFLSVNAVKGNVDGTGNSDKQELNQVIEYLDKLIIDLAGKDEFSGTILVAKDGKPFYKKAVGEANKSYGIPNKLDTKFNLASMNKMFTGTSIMQLVQQGKIALDDYVGKYLPDYPNEAIKEKVKIHHLLTHTSGMSLYWREFFENPRWAHLKSVKDFDDLINEKPLMSEPGEKFFYSNCGPLVLGLIIEKVSGLSYDDYVRENVTGPAGMVNTDCYDISEIIENYAIGYTKMNIFGGTPYETWHPNTFINPVKGGPAGGGYSTVEDLLKFDIALRSNQLLDKEHFQLMTTGKIDAERVGGKYAYLFQERFENGHRIIGHSGGAAGIHSQLEMYMDLGYTVAVMSNYDRGAIGIVRSLREFLTQDK